MNLFITDSVSAVTPMCTITNLFTLKEGDCTLYLFSEEKINFN